MRKQSGKLKRKTFFHYYKWLVGIVIILFLVAYVANLLGIRPVERSTESELNITLPPGFVIDVFAKSLGESPLAYPGPNTGPRFMELKDDKLFVSLTAQGKVVVILDNDKDGRSDKIMTFIENLNKPHGLALYQDWIYIAEEHRVTRVKDRNSDNIADLDALETVVSEIPTGGHFTRTIKIRGDDLYISVGSSCNVCHESEEWRASIVKCKVDGTNCSVFAKGIRNAVGFVFHPITGEIWATENGRDFLGDELPPDEVNVIQKDKNYGWPVCYGNKINDRDFDKNVYIRDPCADTESPVAELQAHSAPLGLAFYFGNNFPSEYQGDLFVAYHGSWNRGVPTGYKIARLEIENSTVMTIKDFAIGWLTNDLTVIGRPVDIIVANDGSIFVSDDNAGKIYRIYYRD